MNRRQAFFLTGVCSFILTGCTPSLPSGNWRTSLETFGQRTLIHLTCTGDGLGHVLARSIKTGLEGASIGIDQTESLLVPDEQDSSTFVAIRTAAYMGAGVGLVYGAGESLLKAPGLYNTCLSLHMNAPTLAPFSNSPMRRQQAFTSPL